MKNLNTLLLLTLLSVFTTSSFAQTITWDGGAMTTDWMDPMNWDTDMIPTVIDDVLIDGATVVLSASTTVRRVNVTGTSMFTIDAGVTLDVIAFPGNDDGFEANNSATIINDGTLNVSNIVGGTAADALYVRGAFTNNGAIAIDGAGQHGLYVQRGNFTNSPGATITITNYGTMNGDGDGLYVDDSGTTLGLLTNDGTITIAMTSGDDGIYVNDGSTLDNNAMLTVMGAGDNGLRLDDNGIFNNNTGGTFSVDGGTDDQIFVDNTGAQFNNSATVNLTNADAGDAGLYVIDAGTFTNNADGFVNISGFANYGIQIDANASTAEIINYGTMTVTGGGNDGMRIQEGGLFTNEAGGVLTFDASGDEGIQIDDSVGSFSTFDNSGTVNITNAVDHGMELFGTFNNLMGGLVQADGCADDGIRMQDLSVFNNDGDIRVDNSGSEDIETETVASWVNSATATFAPGSSPGDLEIRDDFDLGTSCTTFEITGTAATTDYDQILNTVTANTMTISAATAKLDWGAFVPAPLDCFTIVDGSGMVAGTFATITSTNPSIVYTVDYSDPTEVEICIDAILPVVLLDFKAKKTDRGAELFWATEKETANEGYDIERSTDGQNWERIGYVSGGGDTFEKSEYNYIDATPDNGANYYRLKQIDFNGKFTYSEVALLNVRVERSQFSLYPNPVHDVLNLELNEDSKNLILEIHDSKGKLLWSKNGGTSKVSFAEYKMGVYFLSIVTLSDRTVHKIIKR